MAHTSQPANLNYQPTDRQTRHALYAAAIMYVADNFDSFAQWCEFTGEEIAYAKREIIRAALATSDKVIQDAQREGLINE